MTMRIPFKTLRSRRRHFQLCPLVNRVGEVSSSVVALSQERVVRTEPPRFYSELQAQSFESYNGTQISPGVYLHECGDVSVMARTEFLFKNNVCYYPEVIEPEKHLFTAEIEGRAELSPRHDAIKIKYKSHKRIDGPVFSLFGQCNGNYLHFLTEALTRLALIEEMQHLSSIPILVEDGLHPKLYEALDLLNIRGREIIRIKNYSVVHVKKLFYITPPSFTPPRMREVGVNNKTLNPGHEQFKFSHEALSKLRDLAVSVASKYVPCLSKSKYLGSAATKDSDIGYLFTAGRRVFHSCDSRRFYCVRNAASVGNGRLVRNDDKVMPLLLALGFTDVYLSDYTFPEQVLFLRGAEVVVSPVGASLGNLIFRDPGCQVILLSPSYPNASYFYFSNLLSALGHNVYFVLGRQVSGGDGARENWDFVVPINVLQDTLVDLNLSGSGLRNLRGNPPIFGGGSEVEFSR